MGPLPGLSRLPSPGSRFDGLTIEPAEMFCSRLGTVLSADCVLGPAADCAAWLTEAACIAAPFGLVVCCGAANGVSLVAAAEAPA